MKIIATAAVTMLAGLARIAGCDPEPAPAPNPPVYQTSSWGNISLNAYAACGLFNATITNGSGHDTPAIFTFYADGAEHERIYLNTDDSRDVKIYFPNDSGDHTVNVRWPGQASTYRVWTDCAP